MPGKANFSVNDIGLRIEAGVEIKVKALITMLCYVGEQCIKEARENGSYRDQTGNLRSSIGYAVLRDGNVIQKNYAGKTGEGYAGEAEGKSFLKQKIGLAPKKGLVLIVTAGMNYAEYVEAMGYNVLSSAELKAEYLVRTMLTRLGFEFK